MIEQNDFATRMLRIEAALDDYERAIEAAVRWHKEWRERNPKASVDEL